MKREGKEREAKRGKEARANLFKKRKEKGEKRKRKERNDYRSRFGLN